jgi:hypothetical protein
MVAFGPMRRLCCVVLAMSLVSACDSGGDPPMPDARVSDGSLSDASSSRDGATMDGGDASLRDGGDLADAPLADGGSMHDAAMHDASGLDAESFHDAYVGLDASAFDAGHDAFVPDDAFVPIDAFVPFDAFVPRDAGVDARTGGGCVSGATGTHVLRFRWRGSGPGSTAYVDYEANTLPDTSRWRVSAASMSIGYTPRFDDTFLGEGGLDLSGTVFIDVELSTSGLSSISDVSIGIYGRSFATTSSGSFRWQTFSGVGATPSGSVANSAPYEWYRGDATAAFVPGDSGVLLRLRAGPPSSALIVNRVEVCFTAS